MNDKTTQDNYVGDSYLKIQINKEEKFSYSAETKQSLIQLVADLGGLLGLYFGIPFIEIGLLIDVFIKNFQHLLIFWIRTRYSTFFTSFKKFLIKLKNMLNFIQKINFRFISKLIFAPILIFQLLIMIILYFQYPTQTTYEFIPYNISDNLYSLEEFPAITICTQELFKKIWFQNYYEHDIIDMDELDLNSEGLNYFKNSIPHLKLFEDEFSVSFYEFSESFKLQTNIF